MKYSHKTFLKNQIYYVLVVFKDKNNYGEQYPNEYKTLKNALKKFAELKASGLYQMVTLRKEEVWLRSPNTELSSSSPIEQWEAA